MSPFVSFSSDKLRFELKNKRVIKQWLMNVAKKEGYILQSLAYIFTTDKGLLKINQQYLNHNSLTDIITFDLSDSKKTIEGEIYISIERVKENSLKFAGSFEEELKRVMVHGLLHLTGHKDKTPAEKTSMRKKEDQYLGSSVPRGTSSKPKIQK